MGAPGDVANALADAGRGVGGALGAALLDQAARCREAARDRVAAASERAEAVKLDPDAPPSLPARLRDAARADEREVQPLLDELGAGPEGVLSTALARWSAAVATRAGDKKRAAVLREGLAPVTAAAARDRIDQEAANGAPLDPASLERLRGGITGAAGVAVLTWIEAGNHARRGEIAAALGADGTGDRGERRRDPARPAGPADRERNDRSRRARGRVRSVAARRPGPPRRGGAGARGRPASGGERGRPDGGARRAADGDRGGARIGAVLVGGGRRRAGRTAGRRGRDARLRRRDVGRRARWRPGCVPARVRASPSASRSAHSKRCRRKVGKAAEATGAPVAHPFELEARARLAERAGDAGALAPMLAAAAGGADPGPRRVARAPARGAGRSPRSTARGGRACWRRRSRDVPDDPAALPLLLLEDAVAPAAAGEALWRAGTAAADASAAPIARLYRLAASESAALTGGRSRRGRDAHRSWWWRCPPTGSRSARCCGRPRVFRRISGRARWPSGPRSRRGRAGPPSMRPTRRGVDRRGSAGGGRMTRGRRRRFGALANGRFAADAKRALARLDARARGQGQMAGDAVGLPGGLLAGPADDAVGRRADWR